MQRNPSLVQQGPSSSKHGAIPLILIHDGGGTTFSYHCLGPLQRTVYAIHNPKFYTGRPWKGGIPAMAKVYADLIRMIIPSGKVLLGGWSLGGLIALEIASVLAQTSALTVVGIVMIDSIYPGGLKNRRENVVAHAPIISSRCKPEIRMLMASTMQASFKMAEEWVLTTWSGRSSRRRWESSFPGPQESDSGYVTSNEIDNGKIPSGLQPASHLLLPPPTVLLRCKDFVPVSKCGNPNAISRVDVAREEKLLGWEQYDYDLICAVLDVPGHHFNLFSEMHIEQTGLRIMEACNLLENSEVGTNNIPDALTVDLF